MCYQHLCKARIALITALALPFLGACTIGQMGNCGAFCGSGTVVRNELGAPPKDATLGQILGLGHPEVQGYWVWSRRTIERVGDLSEQPKVEIHRYASTLPSVDRNNSQRFITTWGTNELDPKTQNVKKGVPIKAPSVPPGLYRLTSQVSFIDKGEFNKYLPFQGKPRTTTISVEAGKTTVLSYRTGLDTSTPPHYRLGRRGATGSCRSLAADVQKPQLPRFTPHPDCGTTC